MELTPKKPDFENEGGCPHIHEFHWNNGGTAAVIAAIMNCPHNLAGTSPFCVHGGYHGLGSKDVTDYMRELGAGEDLMQDYSIAIFISGLLDTTCRAPIKGSISDGDGFAGKAVDMRQIMNLSLGLGLYQINFSEKFLIGDLLAAVPEFLTGNPANPSDSEYFMQQFWEPVHALNKTRQARVRLIVQSLENERKGI